MGGGKGKGKVTKYYLSCAFASHYLLVREVREHLICWGTFQVSFFLSFLKLFFFSFFKFCQLLVSEFLSGIESAEILSRVVDVRA